MPAIFLPHGGGPWPWISSQRSAYQKMRAYMQSIPDMLPRTPSAVLLISAHWEQPKATLQAAHAPPMLYDYSGFPAETYQVQWPAPGATELAGEIESLLQGGGVQAGLDTDRGYDHGAFVPMSLIDPDARIPTLQLSLLEGLDPAAHLRMGELLAPLRERGVLLLGSGMSYHNMRGFQTFMNGGPAPTEPSRAFDEWLARTVSAKQDERQQALAEWSLAPFARACHPREEHLMPLHVIAGAALDDLATLPYRDQLMGAQVSAVHFGA